MLKLIDSQEQPTWSAPSSISPPLTLLVLAVKPPPLQQQRGAGDPGPGRPLAYRVNSRGRSLPLHQHAPRSLKKLEQ
jgi:hypothetical protein